MKRKRLSLCIDCRNGDCDSCYELDCDCNMKFAHRPRSRTHTASLCRRNKGRSRTGVPRTGH